MGLLGRDTGSWERTQAWMDRVQTADEEWQAMLAGEHILSGGGTFNPVIELDGYQVGRLVMKRGVQQARQTAGITEY